MGVAISGREVRALCSRKLFGNLTHPYWFFHSDEEKSTSWLHPGTDSPIQSGHSTGPGKESPAPALAVAEELEVVMETLGPRPILTSLL